MKVIIRAIFIAGFIFVHSSGAQAQISEYSYAAVKVITPVTRIKNETTNICLSKALASANIKGHADRSFYKPDECIIANNTITERTSTANFSVVGEPNLIYAVTLPASYNIRQGTCIITGRIFINSPSSVYILGPDGTQKLGVGATLNAAYVPLRRYFDSALISVTVNYY